MTADMLTGELETHLMKLNVCLSNELVKPNLAKHMSAQGGAVVRISRLLEEGNYVCQSQKGIFRTAGRILISLTV